MGGEEERRREGEKSESEKHTGRIKKASLFI